MKNKIEQIVGKVESGHLEPKEAVDELFDLCVVSQLRKLLLAYNEEVNQCMVDSQNILDESDVNEFLANNCG
jgi:hypothetical protein